MTWGGDDGQLVSSGPEALRLGGSVGECLSMYMLSLWIGVQVLPHLRSLYLGGAEWALGGAPGHS